MESSQLQTADTTQVSSKQTPSLLLLLPPEIRILIYRYLLVRRTGIVSESSNLHSPRTPLLYPNILRTCRTIHKEASKILFGENAFLFHCVVFEMDYHHQLCRLIPKHALNKMEQVEIQFRARLRSFESADICTKLNEIATYGSPLKLLRLCFDSNPPYSPQPRGTEDSLSVEVTEVLCRVPVSQSIEVIVKADKECEEAKLRAWITSVCRTKEWEVRGTKQTRHSKIPSGWSEDGKVTSSVMVTEHTWSWVLEPPG